MLKKAGGRIAAFAVLLLAGAGFAQADSPVVTVIQNTGDRLFPVAIPEGTVSATSAITVYVKDIQLDPVPPGSTIGVVTVTATIHNPDDNTLVETVDIGVLVTNLTPTVHTATATTDIYGAAVTGIIIPGMRLNVGPVNNNPVRTVSVQGGASLGATSRFAMISITDISYAYHIMVKTGAEFDHETEPLPIALFYGYSSNPLPGIGVAAFTVANVHEGYDGNPQAVGNIPYLRLKHGQTVSSRIPLQAFNVESRALGSEALFSAVGLPAGLALSRSGILSGIFTGTPAAFTVRLADARTPSNFAEQPMTIVSSPYNVHASISWDRAVNYTVAVLEGPIYDTNATNLSGTVIISTDITLGRLFYVRSVPVEGALEELAPLEMSVPQPFGGVTATLLSTWITSEIRGYDLPGGAKTGILGRVRYQRFGLDMLLKHGKTIDYAKDSSRITLSSHFRSTLSQVQNIVFNAAVSVVVSATASKPITSFVPFTLFDSPIDDEKIAKTGDDPSFSEIGADVDGLFTIDLKNYTTAGSAEPPYYHFRNADLVTVNEVTQDRQDERYIFGFHNTKDKAALGGALVSVLVYDTWWPIGCEQHDGSTVAAYCEGDGRSIFHDNFTVMTMTLSYMRRETFGAIAYSRIENAIGDVYMGGGYCLLGLRVDRSAYPPKTTTFTVTEDFGGSDVSVNVTGPTDMKLSVLGPSPGDPPGRIDCYGLYQEGTLSASSVSTTLQYTLHIVKGGVTLAEHAYDMTLDRGLGAGTLTLETNVETSHVYRGFQSVDPDAVLSISVVGNDRGPLGWARFSMLSTGLSVVARAPQLGRVQYLTMSFDDPADGSSFTATLAFLTDRTDVIRGRQTLNIAAGDHIGFTHAEDIDTGLSIVIKNDSLHSHVVGVSLLDFAGGTSQFSEGLTIDLDALRSDGEADIRIKGGHVFPDIGFGDYPTLVASLDFDTQSTQLPPRFHENLPFIIAMRSTADLNIPPSISFSPVAVTIPSITLRGAMATNLTLTVVDLNIETPLVWVSDGRFRLVQAGEAPFTRSYGLMVNADAVFSRNSGDIEVTVTAEDEAGVRAALTQTVSFIANDAPVVSADPAGGVTLTANLFSDMPENKSTGATFNVADGIPVQGGFRMNLNDERFTLVYNETASSVSNFKYDLQTRAGSTFDPEEEALIFLTISAEDREGQASNPINYTIWVEAPRIDVAGIHREVLPVLTREILQVNSQHLEDHISTLRPLDGGGLGLGLDDAGVQVMREMLLRKEQGLEEGDLNLAKFIDGQSFALPLAQNADGGVQVGFWGRGDYSAIEQKEDDELRHAFEGDLLSGSLGLEAVSETFAVGVGMGYHSGEFEVRRGVELNDDNDENWIDYGIDMYTVNPYVAAFLGDAGKAWLALTYGQGDVDFVEGLECTASNAADCDLGYEAGCAAGDARCRSVDNGTLQSKGFSIGGISDLMALTDSTGAGRLNLKLHYSQHASEYSNEDGADVQLPIKIEGIESRAARLGLEYEIDIDADGATVTPSFAAYMRGSSDTAGRDAEKKSSSGFESVLGMSFSSVDFPVSFGIKGRFLQINELSAAGGHLEMAYGVSSADGGLGLSFSLRPSYGGLGTGEQLFEAEELADLAVPGGRGLRMGSEVAYGMAVPYGLFTPYGSYQVRPDDDNEYVLGMNYSHGGFSRVGVSMLGLQGKDAQNLKIEYYLDFQE